MICGDCSTSLKGATQCPRCGWKVPPRLQPDPPRAPDLRPGPRKGWQSNPHMEAIRAAYAKSQARRSGAGMGAVREALSAIREPGEDREESNAPNHPAAGESQAPAPSEPGNAGTNRSAQGGAPALGIPWDSLEEDFANGANP